MKHNSYISNSRFIMITRRTVAVVVTMALVIVGGYIIQEVTRAKSSEVKDLSRSTYFTDPEQYDVIFLGTSHALYGISPFDIWNECRITSYNWGSPASTIPSDYWKLVNILDYQKPGLVVLDCYNVSMTYKTMSEYRIHEAFDSFPLSYHKCLAIKDLMQGQRRKDDDLIYSKEEQVNILFPISAYHSRWDRLTEEDFDYQLIDTKGAGLLAGVAEPIEMSATSAKAKLATDSYGIQYLRKIIEKCQEDSIPILLVYIPFPVTEEWKMEANMVYDIAEEYELEYIDFTNLDVVDFKTDCFDPNSHLNLFGQEKVSRYIGRYIIEHYDIQSYSSDTNTGKKWDDLYEEYSVYRRELIGEMN